MLRLLATFVRYLRHKLIGCRQRIGWFRDEVMVARGSVVAKDAVLGRRVRITSPAHVDPCIIGPYSLIGRVVIRSANHRTEFPNMQEYVQRRVIKGRSVLRPPDRLVTIGAGCWIGDGVIILEGVEIGDGVVIGAGSVVTKSIPSYAIAVGSPARVLKYRFSEEVRDLLAGVPWWEWSDAKLAANKAWFETDLTTASLDEVRAAIDAIVEV